MPKGEGQNTDKNYISGLVLYIRVVNKTFVKVSISIILAGVAIAALGLMIKISHNSCLEKDRALEGGGPLCREDDSATYFLAALPVMIIGIFVLVLTKKDAPILQKIFGTEPKQW